MPVASSSNTVSKVFDIAVSNALSPKAMAEAFAVETRRIRDGYIANGSASPIYDTIVDGQLGVKEEQVKIGGSVVYVFSQLGAAVLFAYVYAVARSPRRSGRYAGSWIVTVNGALYEGDLEKIPGDALVMLANIQPYSRKIETGAQKTYVPGRVTEDTRQAVSRRFPTIFAGRAFVNLGGSVSKFGVEVPYILRGRAHHPDAIASRRTRLARRGVSYHAPGRDTARGAEMSYPAVVLSTVLK